VKSTNAEIDQAVADLQAEKTRFARETVGERIAMIRRIKKSFPKVAEAWVASSCQAKGIVPGTHAEGEEWLGGPMVIIRNIRLLEETLLSIERTGRPPFDRSGLKTRSDGQVVADVFPATAYEKLMFVGTTAEIWMQPDHTADAIYEAMGQEYRDPNRMEREGAVSLVLGAGNVSSIGPMDAFYKLYTEGRVCILKMNPVNEYLGPLIEKGLKPLIDANQLRVVYGGADVGGYLCNHAGVDDIHITGSDRTHDAIVWGVGEEQERNKQANTPVCVKPITSELGNVSPVILVPGPWTRNDIRFQAENIASMVMNNASFNCNAAKLLITQESWDLRADVLDEVSHLFETLPERKAYYPGAQDRYDTFLKAHPEAQAHGKRTDDVVPWTLIPGLDPSDETEMAFRTEAFCGVLNEVGLPSGEPAQFVRDAVDFCNQRVWGTLNACILVHPTTAKDPAMAQVLDDAVRDLKYGTIGINLWPALGYGMTVTPWGAHPGHTLDDIQSGIGFVHNTLMFENIQKGVVRGPFRFSPKPAWFPTNRQAVSIGKKLTAFESGPGFSGFLGVVSSAVRG
jgi:acyl-CoA reductase-like NAD-dependent aldehyde dehydrogenase